MPSKKSTATAPPYAQPLVPGESVILPTKKLKRIFIGLGWNNANGATVDLDCSIVGYGADGTRDDQSTVYYGRLRNGKQRSSPMGSSIVHTGDILKGKEGNAVLEDMERIYVYLSEVPDHLATIAFAADVFTDQLSFSSLSNAYVRIVNADTNQELARLTLTSAYLGPIAQSRVVLLARLRRLAGVGTADGGGEGLWSLESTAEPRAQTLRETYGEQPDMAAVTVVSGIPLAGPVQPIAPVVAQPAAVPAGVPPAGKHQGAGGAGGVAGAPAKRRGRAFVCPALAVATTAGVAAATAIFLMSSDLSSLMLSPELFTAGVDFSTLELPDVSGAGAFFEEGLAATGGALEGGIEMAGSGLEAAGEMAGSGLEAAGEMANEGAGFCGGLCGSLCSSGSVQQAEEMATGAAEQVSTMAGEGLAAATAMATGAAEQVSTLAGEGLTTVAALAGDGLATVTAVASTAGETVMKVVEGVSEVVGALGSSSD
jgi:stress response protein SCP2